MRQWKAGLILLALFIGCALPAVGLAGSPNPSVTWGVQPQPSSAGGVIPSEVGNNWVYHYTVYDGDGVTDTLPIHICVTAQNASPWVAFSAAFSGSGSLPGVTLPSDVTFTYPLATLPFCETRTIQVATGGLQLTDPNVAQSFQANLKVDPKGKDPNNLELTTGENIKIHVTVEPRPVTATCFITDSEGNLLMDCSGQPVGDSGSTKGRFAIVANRKGVEVATNPGQFYFNVLYHNTTGAPQVLAVQFARAGVNPKGAQAIHALAFNPPFAGISVEDFNAVNDGMPGGSDDLIENLTVPAGWTLWVSYHLEWAGLGGAVPSGCATTCPEANQPFTVTATLQNGGDQVGSCTAGAAGYTR